MTDRPERKADDYHGPAGGWGSLRGVSEIMLREKVGPAVAAELLRQNKPGGFACVSCAWPKPAHPHPAEFCEDGAKATAWELTSLRTTPDFFRDHSLTELRTWSDHALEQHGRLTQPLRYDPATDRYAAVAWADAFAEIGAELRALDPHAVVFYASGRASLETSYMWQLMARMYGSQNLPDSSNMCHESTSVGLKKVLGAPVGTTVLDDFEACDCILFFGQNVGSNSPRMLHDLRSAVKRGCKIITFNPLRERGLEAFTDPQNPIEMATRGETAISTQYHQVKAGGDLAVMMGMAKALIAMDDAAPAEGRLPVIDHAFIAEHTDGWPAFEAAARAASWSDIEAASALTRDAIEAAATVYGEAKATIGIYGMGLTQHVHGVDNVKMVASLLLMKGNIGRRGAGICPVRGHSNVQGQRTVGVTEKPELAPLDQLKALYGFEPPRWKGTDTVGACRGVIDGSVRGFVALGGNFARAVPETEMIEAAWTKLRLSVQIATKLNRNHLLPGAVTYLLPCLGRIEEDRTGGGARQAVSVEDSSSCIHGSVGKATPASEHLLSEPAIVAGIAKATLDPNPKVDWDAWLGDYSKVRDAIERTWPDQFAGFNARMFTPGGFHRNNSARERKWKTDSGKAEFSVPPGLDAAGFAAKAGRMRLITLRSNDQFNTTIYGMSDRLRGIEGRRDILMMAQADIDRMGFRADQSVTIESDADDGQVRRVTGLKILPYLIPEGCIGAYYPEINPVIPLEHHAIESHVPAAKSVPVRVVPA